VTHRYSGLSLLSLVSLATACTGAVDAPGEGGPDGAGATGGVANAATGGGQAQAGATARGGSAGSGGFGNAGRAGNGNGGVGNGGSGGALVGAAGSVSIPAGPGPRVGSCLMFPPEDHWNQDVSSAPADPEWTRRIQQLVGDVNIHPDFGGTRDELYGIPINVVPATQAAVPVSFDWYEDESDPGPYPFPAPGLGLIEGNNPLECDGDCHYIVVQEGSCQLFEGYACYFDAGWHCGGGARWDLNRVSYGQRAKGWTSADAAGMAIAPGILRHDEVRAGAVRHALRFTLPCTRANYVAPATHHAVPGGCDENNPNAPPMGMRVRLRADYDISRAPASAQVVLTAMKRYGMILADNGSSFYFQGEANVGWTEDDIDPLKAVPASAFEVVAMAPMED
jgi:hypothetical protein